MAAGLVQIPTPYDHELIKLNVELNATYLPFGDNAQQHEQQQAKADKSAEGLGIQSYAQRAIAKSTALYRNIGWDLVDAMRDDKAKLNLPNISATELPPAMQALPPADREEFVARIGQKRGDVQQRIQDISKDRERFLETKKKESAPAGPSLDDAMRRSLRKQAEASGFQFEQ